MDIRRKDNLKKVKTKIKYIKTHEGGRMKL